MILHDDVDDAADGIGTVDRRGAVHQHLDSVDRTQWNVGHVGKIAEIACAGEAVSVDEHQGRIRAETPQVHTGRKRGVGAGVIDKSESALFCGDPAEITGKRLEHLPDTTVAIRVDLLSSDRRNVRPDRRLASNIRPRDDDVLLVRLNITGLRRKAVAYLSFRRANRCIICRVFLQHNHLGVDAADTKAAVCEQSLEGNGRGQAHIHRRDLTSRHGLGGIDQLEPCLPREYRQRRLQ